MRWSTYIRLKEYNLALSNLDRAINADPKLMKAYNYRANCFLNKKDYKRAIAYFTKVIELNPEYADAYDSRC